MKALLINKPGDLQIIDVDMPEPANNEVLVKVEAVSLCNQHDVKVWTGGYQRLQYLEYGIPGFPGHEGAGTVIKTGNKVTSLQEGDRVVMSGLGGPPLYQEYVTREADQVVKFSSSLGFEEVAMSELLGCVHHGMQKIESWKDKTVLISGMGPAGLGALQMAKALGAQRVIGTDINESRLKLGAELGADKTYDANLDDTLLHLQKEAPEIVFESSGNSNAYRASVSTAREAVILFGYTEQEICLDPYPIFDHELAIYGAKWLGVTDLNAVVKFIEQGKINSRKMVSEILSFDDYLSAIELVKNGRAIKVIMKP
jgi:L-iditol 2-dehydrogenase